MNRREQQLRERDIRRDSPDQNPIEFMRRYLASNFPQTMAVPNKDQRLMGPPMTPVGNDLNSGQKPLSGIKYDDPGVK